MVEVLPETSKERLCGRKVILAGDALNDRQSLDGNGELKMGRDAECL